MDEGDGCGALAKHYGDKPELLLCPEANMRRTAGPNQATQEHRIPIHTFTNSAALTNGATIYGGPRTAFAFRADPALEPTPDAHWHASYGANVWIYNINGSQLQGRPAKRHGRGINMLFFDGSVRSTQRPTDLWKMKWTPTFNVDKWTNVNFPAWMK